MTLFISIFSEAEDAKFEELTDAELVCPVYAVPGATVTWTRQGDELPSNAEPRGNKLLITGFDDTTAGLYTCTVQIDQNTIEGYVNARIFGTYYFSIRLNYRFFQFLIPLSRSS